MRENSHQPTAALRSAKAYSLFGFMALVLIVTFIGGWGAVASLSGAVIARGSIVIETDAKKVQHPFGGVIADIKIRNGDTVRRGDVLVRLDDTVLRANAASIQKSLGELRLRRARLFAERDALRTIELPLDLAPRSTELAEAILNERRLFDLRSSARFGRKAQIEERINQLKNEAQGYLVQRESIDAQIKFITQELEGLRQLLSQQLVPLSRVSALEREGARLDGVRGQLISGIAQTEGKIAEARLTILQIDSDLFSEVGGELRDIDAKIGPLEEQLNAAQDQLSRIFITAPEDGVVHQLNVKTIGGVVAVGEVLMLIVPTGDTLAVDAQINPTDIDQIRVGAPVMVRISAFNQRTTPELNGVLTRASPDTVTEQRSGATFYTVRIELPQDEIRRLGSMPVLPGMQVEAFIKTGDRRVFEMLLKPITDQLMRAYRQD